MSSISEQIVDIVINSGDKVLTDKVISVLVDKGIILENISFEDITDLAEADGDMPYFEFETAKVDCKVLRVARQKNFTALNDDFTSKF